MPGIAHHPGKAVRWQGIVEETTVGPYAAIVPTITGSGWITGFAQYVVDPTDPFPNGWTVGDIW